MRRRLYFLMPDAERARALRDTLLLARVDDAHIHVMARDGTALADLHEAGPLQKTDLVHGAETGLAVGGGIGIVAGLVAVLFPPAGVDLQLVTILLTALIGATFGAWVASMVAASIPNSRLARYTAALDAGQVLVMADVPALRVEAVREAVSRNHPEHGRPSMEPTIPAFP